MRRLEQLAYETLSTSLRLITRVGGSLVADSHIRNLNVGLCLVQCGLVEHPLVSQMALTNKQYVAYWSNDEKLEQMLHYWLQAEVLLAKKEPLSQRDKEIINKASAFCINSFSEYEQELLKCAESNTLPRVNWYTFLMQCILIAKLCHFVPNNELLNYYNRISTFTVYQFASHLLKAKHKSLLDFCLIILKQNQALHDSLPEFTKTISDTLLSTLTSDVFWNSSSDSDFSHMVMDLSIAGTLPVEIRDKAIQSLTKRIKRIINDSPIDIQSLIRTTRALGELSSQFEELPMKLYRQLGQVYGTSILEQIRRRTIDERGYVDDAVINCVAQLNFLPQDNWSFKYHKIFNAPFATPTFLPSAELEYLDVVRPPAATLNYGGDCDCIAAMYASMLLNAGCKEVKTLHLQRERYPGTFEHHAVTCVESEKDIGKYYAFDAVSKPEGGDLPQLNISQDIAYEKLDSSVSPWKIIAQDTYRAHDIQRTEFSHHEPVGGFHEGANQIHREKGKTTRILLYKSVDKDDGIDATIRRHMQQKTLAYRNHYSDNVIHYPDDTFSEALKEFGLSIRETPAFILEPCQTINSNVPPLVLQANLLRKMQNYYGGDGTLMRLEDLSYELSSLAFNNLQRDIAVEQIKNVITRILVEFKNEIIKALKE